MINNDKRAFDHDEIDIRELALIVFERRHVIFIAVATTLLLAISYLMLSTKVYEAKFRATPASSSAFADLNLLEGFKVQPEDAYWALVNRLGSFQSFSEYVNAHPDQFLIPEGAKLKGIFERRLKVRGLSSSQEDGLSLEVTYLYPEGEDGPTILNNYLAYTADSVWRELRENFQAYNNVQIRSLSTDLELQKEALLASRRKRIFDLEQAIMTARRLGIAKPTTPQDMSREKGKSEVVYAYLGSDNSLPLYFMGYKALEADMGTLKASLDQGLSTEHIRNTEQRLSQRLRIADLLMSGELTSGNTELSPGQRVVSVVESAFPASEPVKPKSALVLLGAFVFGAMFGLFLIFLMHFISHLREMKHRRSDKPGTRNGTFEKEPVTMTLQ